MKPLSCCTVLLALILLTPRLEGSAPPAGIASWYGDELRGNLMANGQPFDPRKLTAASWFYPLGTRVRVTLNRPAAGQPAPNVIVTITDRGPARRLVDQGRIIDLAAAAFDRLASRDLGLIEVTVEEIFDGPTTGPGP